MAQSPLIGRPPSLAAFAQGAPAGGVTVIDAGGYWTGEDLETILAEFGAGLLAAYLTVIGGGKGTVQAHGTLGATETIDLANGNFHWGTLDANCTISTTGWTNLKDCQITVELIQNGTGGWTPTFSGVTWIGGTPDFITTAGTVTHVVLLSRDGGTTIYGSVVGTGGSLGVGVVQAHGNLGATETIDATDGKTYHWGTLDANCTFTFTTIADTAERWFTLELIENGTGGWTVTWPGSVTWLGGTTPTHTTTAGTTTIYSFFTRNGGTTWIGGQLGGGTSLTVKNEGSALATAAATMDFVGDGVTASGTGADKTITISGAALDPQHAHVQNVVFSGDGSTVAFVLPAAPVDATSVGVYVTAARSQDWALSGALLDTLTFGTAPPSAADNIVIDITAVLV